MGPTKYKEGQAPVAGDPKRSKPPRSPNPSPLQQSSSSRNLGQTPASHISNLTEHDLSNQHPVPYTQAGPGANGHPPPAGPYYTSNNSPYGSGAQGQYPSTEAPDMMAAAHMQRPYNVYQTPQPNSPASVASSNGHDQNARLYHQQQQMQQGIYQPYPQYHMGQVHAQYPQQHPGQPQNHQMTSQPMLVSSQHGQPQMHQAPVQHAAMNASPRPKLEPSIQRPLDTHPSQRPPTGPPNGKPIATNGATSNGVGLHHNPQTTASNAAPGPIPATTPLVVKQDESGVQWIAFEYSRDRVKMEYTIRCDVESVNTESLDPNFKTENCVYPRACGDKSQYKGNRLNYETECNNVGWSLAHLNTCLRGKRGLIQRAVDSWRNSNQDPRMRSRRVRRMAKLSTRKQSAAAASNASPMSNPMTNPMATPGVSGGAAGIPQNPNANAMATPVQISRPPPNNMNVGGSQMHHHHAHPDGTAGGPDDVSVHSDYRPQQVSKSEPVGVRQAHVFHGYPNLPPSSSMGASMPPGMHDSMSSLATHSPTIVSVSTPRRSEDDEQPNSTGRPAKRAKNKTGTHLITVKDPDPESRPGRKNPIRVKLNLQEVNPENYSSTNHLSKNSVYPRSCAYLRAQASPGKRDRRVLEYDQGEEDSEDNDEPVCGRTIVPVPSLEEGQHELAVPMISRAKRRKEEQINDMGYRLAWSGQKNLDNRNVLLQIALDTGRKRLLEKRGGTQVSTIPPNLATRPGKTKWEDWKRRNKPAGLPKLK